jgi:hypothetical protein
LDFERRCVIKPAPDFCAPPSHSDTILAAAARAMKRVKSYKVSFTLISLHFTAKAPHQYHSLFTCTAGQIKINPEFERQIEISIIELFDDFTDN